jgi:hypothetical protein
MQNLTAINSPFTDVHSSEWSGSSVQVQQVPQISLHLQIAVEPSQGRHPRQRSSKHRHESIVNSNFNIILKISLHVVDLEYVHTININANQYCENKPTGTLWKAFSGGERG